ncbi:class E sortase [Streptomyces sp. NPDC007084]|uniref:class E sortase n=1 Tax=Streptomyces sp. NPDC007084 TaxID=3154313 RepID=UPI0034514C5A
MTALRPERDSSPYGGEAAYGGADAFEGAGTQVFGGPGAYESAVGGLTDPLTDPLTGPLTDPLTGPLTDPLTGPLTDPLTGPLTDPLPGQSRGLTAPLPGQSRADGQGQGPGQVYEQGGGFPPEWSAAPRQSPPAQASYAGQASDPDQASHEDAVAALPRDDETVALRLADLPRTGAGGSAEPSGAGAGRGAATGSAAGGAGASATGGRAARRKAARRRGRHGGAQEPHEPQESVQGAAEAPLSRLEARRAARARKPSAGVLASRLIGEVFITTGVVMLLFVTYQLWWSNVRAHQQAGSAAHHLQQDWADGKRSPGTFSPGQGFAILHIPKLDVVAPIAEGISKTKVLDRGMVGHYGEGDLKTAMPDAKTGNFALAGHRNTHGEPFRYINRLQPGDEIVVETQDDYYVYKMTSILPVTSPSNTSVLDPVPKGSGFTAPGRYITLTTCTPEFTSKYRMIVWGKMVEDRPRDKGKPDALVG